MCSFSWSAVSVWHVSLVAVSGAKSSADGFLRQSPPAWLFGKSETLQCSDKSCTGLDDCCRQPSRAQTSMWLEWLVRFCMRLCLWLRCQSVMCLCACVSILISHAGTCIPVGCLPACMLLCVTGRSLLAGHCLTGLLDFFLVSNVLAVVS